MTTRMRRTTVSLLGAGLALLAWTPASAAPQTPAAQAGDTSVSVGRLVLEPTERGYRGALSVTVTYRGDKPAYVPISITEPVGGSFAGLDPAEGCGIEYGPRRTLHCAVPGDSMKPGERRTFRVNFQALTLTRRYAMATDGGRVTVQTGDSNPTNDTATFTTLFRSTTGSSRNPRPYIQAIRTDAFVFGTDNTVTLTRQPDGGFLGRLPLTVSNGSDAAHTEFHLTADLPQGVTIAGITPRDVCAGPSCVVYGGQFMVGEERRVELLFKAPAETLPGLLGDGSVTLHVRWGDGDVEDVDPSDDVVPFALTAVDAT